MQLKIETFHLESETKRRNRMMEDPHGIEIVFVIFLVLFFLASSSFHKHIRHNKHFMQMIRIP